MKILVFVIAIFSCTLVKAQEFANVKKYEQANNTIIQSKTKISTIFMGDSITEFWSPNSPDFFKKHNIINRGISGQTTSQMLLRFRQDVINLHPQQVIILAGINDIAENTGLISITATFGNIVSMVELAQANNIKVVISSVLPAYDFNWRKGMQPANKVIALNKLLRDYAQKNKIRYIDYFSLMKDSRNGLDPKYSNDEVHPNLLGYHTMQKIILPFLKKK